jgi:hypothetical protein
MTKETLLEHLRYFFENCPAIDLELYVLYHREGALSTYRPALEERQLRPRLLNDFLAEVRVQFYAPATPYELVSVHTPEASDAEQVFYADYLEIPRAAAVFGPATKGHALSYDGEEATLSGIWGFVVRIGNSQRSLYLFKKNQAFNVIGRDKYYHLFFSNQALTLLNRDTIRLNHTFDVMLLEDHLLILNRKEFERSFDYVKAMQQRALDKIGAIEKLGIVENVGKLAELVENMRTLRKLLAIDLGNVVLHTPPEKIAAFCRDYNIDLKFTTENKIALNTKRSAEQFVKLLNDDYLRSELTQLLYDSKGKKRI